MTMADATLHQNGVDCPACALRRDELRAARRTDQAVACNFCAGTGRVGRAVEMIIRESCEWAASNYWPGQEAAWAAENAARADAETEPPND